MFFAFNSQQATKLTRSLEKSLSKQGIHLAHGQALDALARMKGYNDWNSWKLDILPLPKGRGGRQRGSLTICQPFQIPAMAHVRGFFFHGGLPSRFKQEKASQVLRPERLMN